MFPVVHELRVNECRINWESTYAERTLSETPVYAGWAQVKLYLCWANAEWDPCISWVSTMWSSYAEPTPSEPPVYAGWAPSEALLMQSQRGIRLRLFCVNSCRVREDSVTEPLFDSSNTCMNFYRLFPWEKAIKVHAPCSESFNSMSPSSICLLIVQCLI